MPSGSQRGKRFRVTIDGVEEIQRKLRGVAKQVNGILKTTVRAGAVPFIKEARATAPRGKTGFLRRSIGHEFKVDRPYHVELIVGPSRQAYYGLFIERGTVKMSEQAFLGPAFLNRRAEAERLMISRFKGAVLAAAGGA